MKLLELAKREQDRLLVRNKTSELRRHFNNIEVKLDTVQVQYKMQDLIVSQGKTDEFSENLDVDVARFNDILTKLDEAMQRIAGSENMKENLTADKEDVDIFWKRLYEKTKIEEMRTQMKFDFENKEKEKT